MKKSVIFSINTLIATIFDSFPDAPIGCFSMFSDTGKITANSQIILKTSIDVFLIKNLL